MQTGRGARGWAQCRVWPALPLCRVQECKQRDRSAWGLGTEWRGGSRSDFSACRLEAGLCLAHSTLAERVTLSLVSAGLPRAGARGPRGYVCEDVCSLHGEGWD